MPKAPRKKAKDVQVGDWVLTCYAPRTWQPVTAVAHYSPEQAARDIMIDTETCRVWFESADLVPCKPRVI